MEEIVHVPKMIPQKRVVQQMVEQIVGVPVPVTQEEIVHVPKIEFWDGSDSRRPNQE